MQLFIEFDLCLFKEYKRSDEVRDLLGLALNFAYMKLFMKLTENYGKPIDIYIKKQYYIYEFVDFCRIGENIDVY